MREVGGGKREAVRLQHSRLSVRKPPTRPLRVRSRGSVRSVATAVTDRVADVADVAATAAEGEVVRASDPRRAGRRL
jgi:hypothetical protein